MNSVDKKWAEKHGISEKEMERKNQKLEERIHSDRDNWGPCCPGCPFWGQATKGCGPWCLK